MPLNDLPALPAAALPQGLLALPDWGLIVAEGADAASFMQGQLTQDVQGLAVGGARLAGYCSAKGRLLASFIVLRESPDRFWLACSADLLASTLKRLRMFVLRAKCVLTDGTQSHPLVGRIGPPVPDSPWSTQAADGGFWLRLPDAAGQARGVWMGPLAASPLGLDAAPQAQELAAAWAWLEVAAGVPRVAAANVEQFVPQMVNLELVGGVSFQKGCYPGQEVVARSQYRGTLKRRMALAQSGEPAQAGQEVFHSADPGQPAGRVVLATQGTTLPPLALLELKLSAVGSGSLSLGGPDGPTLSLRRLPYEIPQDAN